ncbi:uncharacterized protein LOC107646618 [Arachis ipaensis]|uniref:uncharacterized protein LOC107646618 n=1 Tax=Arachis ipaensis TaxID=130454 RepID=UPI0007AF9DD6|nr:uncharacterized protein LOC107646618 [Arachis ipaensis]
MGGESGREGEGADEGRVFGSTRIADGEGGGDQEGNGERVEIHVSRLADESWKGKNVMEAGEGSGRSHDKAFEGDIGQATPQSMRDAEKRAKGWLRSKTGRFPSVEFTEEAREILSAPYRDAIIIKVLGKSFSYTAITHKFRGVWRTKGGYEVLDVGFGYFLIKFDLWEDRERVLLGGPWMIAGNYVAVKPWCPSFHLCEDFFGSILVWIRIIGLSIWYYSEKAILNIARAVGKPIKVDLATKSAERGKYARACIQINLGQSVIRKILVDGFEYAIEYENLHLICGKCNCFGHVTRDCEKTKGEEETLPVEKTAAPARKEQDGEEDKPSSTTTVKPAEKMVHQNFEFENAGVNAALNVEQADLVQGTLHEILEDINAPIDGEWTTVTKKGKAKIG